MDYLVQNQDYYSKEAFYSRTYNQSLKDRCQNPKFTIQLETFS